MVNSSSSKIGLAIIAAVVTKAAATALVAVDSQSQIVK